MLVSFDPYINTGADITGQYLNFMRCVTAIATAAAGTSSLTVNPWTASGTTDATKNCITQIIANTTAGGWTTSSYHNIPASNSYSAMTTFTTTFAQQYKADFYNSSGKASMPYNKMCFHTEIHNTTGNDNTWNGQTTTPMSNWSNTSYGGQVMMTYGCSTATGITDANFYPNNASFDKVQPNQQTQSWTNNAYHSNYNSYQNPYIRSGFNMFLNPAVTYTMAVTADYCIIWETVRGNSYSAGYNTSYANSTYMSSYGSSSPMYGSLMYGGNRTTQSWEDSLGYNPPWVAFTVHHTQATSGYGGYSQSLPHPPNCAAAYMATINDTGTIASSATRYVNWPPYQYANAYTNTNECPISGTGFSGVFGSADSQDINYWSNAGGQTAYTGHQLQIPIFSHRQRPYRNNSYGTIGNWHANMPTVDPVTGLFVPGAYPIQFTRNASGSWNAGGYAKGIYKSLTMPLATMKLYWAPGQLFTINGVSYTPVVFNEDMYLVAAA